MKLSPVEILKHLGFTVPPDGVDINPHDAFLHVTTLQAVGATMDIMEIPKPALEGLHSGLAGRVSAMNGSESAPAADGANLAKLRMTMASLLKVYYQKAETR